MAKNIRLTIVVTPEVHAGYSALAKASGKSLSATMGEWLGDTLDAVVFTAQKMQQAREAPKLVMREVHAYAQGLADQTGTILERVAAVGAPGSGKRSAQPGAPVPPSSLTGGKSRTPQNRRGGK